MKKLCDRWFWRALAVCIGGALWIIALKLPGAVTPDAMAEMKKDELYEKYPINRMEFAQIRLNTHPSIHILTPHLTSEFIVTEAAVEHQITYDKTMWKEKDIENLLNARHRNAVLLLKAMGFKNFELGDIQVKYEPY